MEVISDRDEIEMEGIGGEAAIAHPMQSVASFENREGALHGGADSPDQLGPCVLRSGREIAGSLVTLDRKRALIPARPRTQT